MSGHGAFRIAIALGTFEDVAVEADTVGSAAEVVGVRLTGTEADAQVLQDVDALIVTNNPVPAAVLRIVPDRLRVLVRAGIGLDAIDLGVATARGIAVANTPGYATDEVATHAIALALAASRRILRADACARHGWAWIDIPEAMPIHELTLGIAGLGRIGRRVAEIARPLFGSILGFDPAPGAAPVGVEPVPSMDDLLRRSNVLTLHLPLTPETRGMIDARAIGLMPSGSVVVNVSRGGLLDEDALAQGLVTGALSGAGLDVLTQEPPASDNPLLDDMRVILTPHSAWASATSSLRVRGQGALTALELLRGVTLTVGSLVNEPASRVRG